MNKSLAMIAMVLLALLLTAAGCAHNQTDSGDGADTLTLYERGGIIIAIPTEYTEKLLIDPELPQGDEIWYAESAEDKPLLSVYHRASYEAYPGAGWLFSIWRYSPAQYEQFLCADGSGQSFFARDDEHYYGFFVATDVQTPDMADYDDYTQLLSALSDSVKEDIVTRNGLTAYSDEEFFSREYTYDSEHIFMRYYPYAALNGKRDVVWTLVLSQPAKQGEDGIWCVERWYDGPDKNSGWVYPYFPYTGLPAAEYYSGEQDACDAGRNTARLDPYQVALEFAKQCFEHDRATMDSFELPSVAPLDAMAILRQFTAVSAGIWYQEAYTANTELARFTLDADSFELKRAEVLCEYYDWMSCEQPILPEGAAVYWGQDRQNCLIFILGTPYVTYVDEGKAYTWETGYLYQGGSGLPDVIMEELYSQLEMDIANLRVVEEGQGHQAVAESILQGWGWVLQNLTPENPYRLYEYTVIEYALHERIDGVSDEFGISCAIAIKPELEQFIGWWAGNTVSGEGTWEGWLIFSREGIFKLEDGMWRMAGFGTGGYFHVNEYGKVYE